MCGLSTAAATRTLSFAPDLNGSRSHLSAGGSYSCIPQVNTTLKRLSISSILVYAPACRFFVAVAPKATHNDRGHECDAATYQRRGW